LEALDENQIAKIAVTSYEDAILFFSNSQEDVIISSGKP
jgi:hypothetical protein